jgi:hypothetical protein
MKWLRVIQDAKHRPMRNCSEQVLNSYNIALYRIALYRWFTLTAMRQI